MKAKINILDIIPVITMLVLFAFFAIVSGGNTVSLFNLQNIVLQAVPVAIGALGVIFVVSLGSTDISVGANGALSATIAALISQSIGGWAMIPLTLIISTAIGFLLGMIITRFKTESFMTTLASLIALRGLMNFILTRATIKAPRYLLKVSTFWISLIILIILAVVVFFIFEKTKFGHYCKGMGENENTIKAIGVNTRRIRLICFCISGFMAGVFGFILLGKVSGASSTLCNMMEMKIQMAIFLGGILVSGGYSAKLFKAIIGSLTIVIIENGLISCGVDTAPSEAIEGILLVAILCITIYSNKLSLKRNDLELLKAKEAGKV
ncbi:MAG: ABC transporter permease [Erysipelotrichaceae bacterium]|nr:ABC transporter permease [Erysipelotrichaceae bacterium]